VSKVDEAAVSCTGIVGGGTLVVSVLGTETPTTGFPQGALLDPVTRFILIAPKAIWKDDVISPMSLPKYGAILQTVFSFFNIRWALGGENAWDPIITGRDKECGGGRGTRSKEVLLKTSADRTGGKVSFYYKQVSFSSSFLLLQL